MIRSDQILNTVEMVQKENLDVRAVTLGITCRTAAATMWQTLVVVSRTKSHVMRASWCPPARP